MTANFDPLSLLMVGKSGQVRTYKFRYLGPGRPVMSKGNIKHETSCGCVAKVRFENGYVVADMTLVPKKGKKGIPHRVRRTITVWFIENGKSTEHKLVLLADIS